MYSEYDYHRPGPSHPSFYNDVSSFYRTRPQSLNPSTSAAERLRESRRGAQQGHKLNYQNKNNMNLYTQNHWSSVQYHQKKQKYTHNHKEKKRERNNYTQKTQGQPKGSWVGNVNSCGMNNPNPNSKIDPKELDYRLYKCPLCLMQFDWSSRYNSYVGRVPLILNCKHTVCQDCIYKLAKNGSVLCSICEKPSVIPVKCGLEDLQEIFSPNFFLIGFIMWSKTQGNNPNLMSLVPAQANYSMKKVATLGMETLLISQQPKETCCFLSCSKPATLHCENCSDVYCSDCCTTVHKSAKSLWSHKQVPLEMKKDTVELGKCPEHNMDNEFYCNNCETDVCCYCLLEKHESHGKENITRLSDEEMEELRLNKENAKKILKQLLISRRRLGDLYSSSTNNIEKKISNYFINYHAKLQFIEKTLKKEISSYSVEGKVLPDLDDLNSELTGSIEILTNLVGSCEAIEQRKLNLKELFIRLRAVQNIPCYLLCEDGNELEPLKFLVDPVADNLESFFRIGKSDCYDFKLVSEEDLPSDYEKDSVDQQYESDAESCLSSLNKSVTSTEGKQKKNIIRKYAGGNQISMENEMVEVTHIESLECFYVQLKRMQYQFSEMNRDINDYIKMGAPTVEHPQLNELYLVMYQINNGKIWCRGRVTELKNGETEPLYEVFFIDYGSTQTVDDSKLRQITSPLAQKKPFAIQCELYNPSMATWGKNAHVYMAKMINGKQVTMLVKKVHSGVHEVDLMIMSSDRGQTSIIDILIHTCNNALNTCNDNDAESGKISYNPGYKIFGNSTVFQKFQQEKVVIVNVIDPHHIFVHLLTHAESLKKMNASLKNTYKNSEKNCCLPVEGTYVIVDYKDSIRGNWHRGLVKKVDLLSEKCHVLLIDWGLNVVVSWNNIRVIREEFTKLESQAILVKLAQIEPLDKGVWLDAAITFLRKYFHSQEHMRMIVHNVDPLEVALFEIVGDVDICINASLVMENFAESTGKISQTLEWSREEAEIKGFTEDDGLVASLLKKVDEAMDDESEDEDQHLVRQKIEVVKFVSPDLIYIKLSMSEKHEMDLNKELQIHYSKERTTKESWNPGEWCVVVYNLSYARAKILEKISANKFKVNVYDRAAEVVLPVEKIFEYAKYFNKFPNVIFKSHLANIRPAGGDKWSLSSIEALEGLFDKYKDIYGTRVSGDITGKSMPMHLWYAQVKLGGALEASKTRFVSLNNLLVKLGFAYKNAPSEAESVKSGKSSRLSTTNAGTKKSSKSSYSSNSESSPFITVFEKISRKSESTVVGSGSTVIDSGTDQDSTVDLKDYESSVSETKDYAASVSSSKEEKFDKVYTSTDWNELVEEEEKRVKKIFDENDSPYRTREAKIVDWIPAFAIKDREFHAWITCAEPEGIIYLREAKLQTVYKDMEKNIKEYFDKNTKTSTKHNWEPGQMCTIRYKDYYYRGKVYKVNGPDDITVIMIDFGSDHTVTEKDLNREILYPKIPAFASKIKLDRVYPKSGAWLESDYQTLLDIITEYGRVVITGSLNEEIPAAEVYTDKDISVNETLVRLCPNLSRCLPTEQAECDDNSSIIECDDNSSIIECDDKLVVEMEHNEEDVMKDISPIVDTTKYVYKVLHLPDKNPEERLHVSIMAVLEYNKVAIKETATINDEFFELGDQMQMAIKSQPIIEHLELGMPCVCPYSEDGIWYRAQIYNMDGLDCGYVFVFFVDFGNVESVAVTDVRLMRPEWFKFPVSCHIADLNIEISSDKNRQHVTQFIKKLYGKNKFAKIITKEPLCVSLHEVNHDLCYQSLLTKGLVKLK